jgi:hypothetical protein
MLKNEKHGKIFFLKTNIGKDEKVSRNINLFLIVW